MMHGTTNITNILIRIVWNWHTLTGFWAHSASLAEGTTVGTECCFLGSKAADHRVLPRFRMSVPLSPLTCSPSWHAQ